MKINVDTYKTYKAPEYEIPVNSLKQAQEEWELSKVPTPKLVKELLTRGNISWDEYTLLTHHLETLMQMNPSGVSEDELKDIKEMMENI